MNHREKYRQIHSHSYFTPMGKLNVSYLLNLHIFGLCEERQTGREQTSQRKAQNLTHFVVTVLTTELKKKEGVFFFKLQAKIILFTLCATYANY